MRLLLQEHSFVKSGTEILENMVAILAEPVAGMDRGGRSADECGARNEVLEMPLSCEKLLPFGKFDHAVSV